MDKKYLEKNKTKISWITGIGFILLLVIIQSISYSKNTSKFEKGNSRITVAEIYKTNWNKGITLYTDYVYKVEGKLYKSGTGGENSNEFKNWKKSESRKYALIYNIENPKLNFLLSEKRLSDTTELGIELKSEYFDYENLESIMTTQTVQTAYIKEKYLKEYKDWKKRKN
ncbi:hypothetical protein [Winogradskyella psychrotolerans]|uniref:hypothetical protein n=1 Tax=Winogradskyella psychrotolerans TaxID=1344585 RepID=UPI001C06CFB9|nr:hypothetical protein [Winogradskyella psychrotolerans]MBU2928026.1 hypothetical protein [Winogradskyella psychrotolerans]